MKTLRNVAVLLFTGVLLVAGAAVHAQKKSDADEVKAVIEAFHAAITARDIKKMETLWAHDNEAILINPRDKDVWVGWDAIKAHWQDTFNFWSEVTVTVRAIPRVHVKQNAAWSASVSEVAGKTKAGQSLGYKVLETAGFEKRGGKWLLVSHHASRMPEDK